MLHVDDEKGIGQAAHVLDATDGSLELVHFTMTHERLSLGELLEGAVIGLRLEVAQALDGLANRLVVREHAAKPTLVDVGLADARSLLPDDLGGSSLGADEEDLVLLRGHRANLTEHLAQARKSLFEIDDVDLVARAENERRHLGIPIASLVAEVHASLQEIPHRYIGHHFAPG